MSDIFRGAVLRRHAASLEHVYVCQPKGAPAPGSAFAMIHLDDFTAFLKDDLEPPAETGGWLTMHEQLRQTREALTHATNTLATFTAESADTATQSDEARHLYARFLDLARRDG
jgi:hypothetical protein